MTASSKKNSKDLDEIQKKIDEALAEWNSRDKSQDDNDTSWGDSVPEWTPVNDSPNRVVAVPASRPKKAIDKKTKE